jgi:hypothetical protein
MSKLQKDYGWMLENKESGTIDSVTTFATREAARKAAVKSKGKYSPVKVFFYIDDSEETEMEAFKELVRNWFGSDPDPDDEDDDDEDIDVDGGDCDTESSWSTPTLPAKKVAQQIQQSRYFGIPIHKAKDIGSRK